MITDPGNRLEPPSLGRIGRGVVHDDDLGRESAAVLRKRIEAPQDEMHLPIDRDQDRYIRTDRPDFQSHIPAREIFDRFGYIAARALGLELEAEAAKESDPRQTLELHQIVRNRGFSRPLGPADRQIFGGSGSAGSTAPIDEMQKRIAINLPDVR